ncbi:hypothetical protein PRO82_000498 [Candidatus Protochlamydia amoebophila]|nr:hypothetical protein [Candidatus Protochlamydia amoebophila]
MVILNISNFGLNPSQFANITTPSYSPLKILTINLRMKNIPLNNPLPNLEETSAPTIPAPALAPSSEKIQLSFQEGTFLTISHSQLALLKEKSPYFKICGRGNFEKPYNTLSI